MVSHLLHEIGSLEEHLERSRWAESSGGRHRDLAPSP